jgi:sterol desaturase/sphingolipid hydroxylase (fatty acid hydroxylase superfamily)
MDTHNRFENVERNPKTHAEHRREVFWQISLPLLIGVLLILAIVIGVIFSATQPITEVSRWANISMIWMIMPALFFALLFMIILAGLVYAISVLFHHVPRYAAIVQLYLERGKEKVNQFSNQIVEPILKTRSTWAVVRWIGRRGK